MIKILFIHSMLVCGGAEQALFDLICLMDKTKFDITVLVQHDGGIWEQKFRDAGIKTVSYWDCQKSSHSPINKLNNYIKRRQIRKAIENDGKNIVDICLGTEYDIIVSYCVWTMQQAGFSGKAKTVKYIHGDVATNLGYHDYMVRSQDLLKRFDRYICVSENGKRSFEALTGITNGVEMHFNPLNSENVRKLSEQRIPDLGKEPIICAVGRLHPEKGFERLIRIHKKLRDEGIVHHLVIVGDGPEEERLHNVITGIGAQESVTMVGYTPNPYPYMKQSSFMVSSSYTEGLPVIAMEALCLGIPIVASVPSVKEVFGNEMCGLITENNDASLEEGIRRMLIDQALFNESKSGAQRRSKFFDGKQMVREIENVFINLINQ